MVLIKAIIMGILQGLTEFLPVSSSGHLAIMGQLLKLQLAEETKEKYALYKRIKELNEKLEMYENKGTKNILPHLNNELTQYEKDECKILISEYLNDSSKNKKLNAKNQKY